MQTCQYEAPATKLRKNESKHHNSALVGAESGPTCAAKVGFFNLSAWLRLKVRQSLPENLKSIFFAERQELKHVILETSRITEGLVAGPH